MMEHLHFFIGGPLMIFAGYMIRFHNKAEWIAGYQETDSTNRKRLTTSIGLASLWLGVLLSLTPLLLSYVEVLATWSGLIFCGIVLLGVILMIVLSQNVK